MEGEHKKKRTTQNTKAKTLQGFRSGNKEESKLPKFKVNGPGTVQSDKAVQVDGLGIIQPDEVGQVEGLRTVHPDEAVQTEGMRIV